VHGEISGWGQRKGRNSGIAPVVIAEGLSCRGHNGGALAKIGQEGGRAGTPSNIQMRCIAGGVGFPGPASSALRHSDSGGVGNVGGMAGRVGTELQSPSQRGTSAHLGLLARNPSNQVRSSVIEPAGSDVHSRIAAALMVAAAWN
jgi:hypothetical protein